MNEREYLYLISKAERKAKSEYRGSAFGALNPRSKTEVRRGSAPSRTVRRGGGFIGGSMAGSAIGGVTGKLLKLKPGSAAQLSSAMGGIGGASGTSLGRTANIKSGDVRATERATGKKAKGNVTIPGGYGSYWTY